jgi:hypothetical protein
VTAGRGRIVALVVVAALACAAVPASAGVPNVCHITGVTRTLGKKIFKKLQGIGNYPTAATTPPNIGAYCAIIPAVAGKGDLVVDLWDKSYFTQQVTTLTGGLRVQKLNGLGKGAVYAYVKGKKNDGSVLFKRGHYTVYLSSNLLGAPNSAYPTENQFLILARAIYKHLR